jgi:hypothetical protein
MRWAHYFACTLMDVRTIPHGGEAWGWRGRTLGRPVVTTRRPAWLRVACVPADQVISLFWNGNVDAATRLPTSVPRPRLRDWRDWNDQQWAFRAELFEWTFAVP